MGTIRVEYYLDETRLSRSGDQIYGRLIGTDEDATTSSTVEHFTVDAVAVYARVIAEEDHFIEIGSGNQDVTSSRRSTVKAGVPFDTSLGIKDTTISYRTVA